MTRTSLRSAAAVACLSMLVVLTATPARAQRLSSDRYKNGKTIRRAFRKVVAKARKATVEILSGGRQVALGAVVEADGYIVTKASQLKGTLRCKLDETWTVDADVVGISPDDDLALIKVDASGLTTVQWQKADPGVGQWLATPGMDPVPVSVGVLSVKRRAIPRARALLGVRIEPHEFGVRITDVSEDSGADKAGIKPGDVITWIAGKDVKDIDTLRSQIQRFRPGDTLELKVLRGKVVIGLKATLGSETSISSRGAIQNRMGGKLSHRRAGFKAVLQHDGYLKPEECGGPLVDLKGRVVGINIARAGRTESYALPADRILALLPMLKSGKFAPPKTGPKLPPAPPLPGDRK